VYVIEHNLDMIKSCDHIIDLGLKAENLVEKFSRRAHLKRLLETYTRTRLLLAKSTPTRSFEYKWCGGAFQ